MSSEVINIEGARKTKKAQAALDRMANDWADETRVDEFIQSFTSDAKSQTKLKEIILMCYSEGLYAGRVSHKVIHTGTIVEVSLNEVDIFSVSGKGEVVAPKANYSYLFDEISVGDEIVLNGASLKVITIESSGSYRAFGVARDEL